MLVLMSEMVDQTVVPGPGVDVAWRWATRRVAGSSRFEPTIVKATEHLAFTSVFKAVSASVTESAEVGATRHRRRRITNAVDPSREEISHVVVPSKRMDVTGKVRATAGSPVTKEAEPTGVDFPTKAIDQPPATATQSKGPFAESGVIRPSKVNPSEQKPSDEVSRSESPMTRILAAVSRDVTKSRSWPGKSETWDGSGEADPSGVEASLGHDASVRPMTRLDRPTRVIVKVSSGVSRSEEGGASAEAEAGSGIALAATEQADSAKVMATKAPVTIRLPSRVVAASKGATASQGGFKVTRPVLISLGPNEATEGVGVSK
jgi:hypothetical protein